MLSARAYSIKKKTILAVSLSWVGGFTNVLTLLFCSTFTSHITGTSTNFGRALAQNDFHDAFFFGALLLTFLAGAALSAVMTESAKQLGHRSKYVLPLAVEATLLCLLVLIARVSDTSLPAATIAMTMIASFAMGMQNATITKISGSVVRTTHLTGVLTDLGLEGVQYGAWYWNQVRGRSLARANRVFKVSQRHPTVHRLVVLGSILLSFIGGVIGATLCYKPFGVWAFSLPIVFLFYLVIVDWRRPIMDIRELDLENDPDLHLHGLLHVILPRELAIFRLSHLKDQPELRAPNFQLWVDRVPQQKRVVILILSSVMKIDANVILDLEQAIEKLNASGRKLLIAGMTRVQCQALDQTGFIEKVGWDSIYPDLEFAIARAAALIRMPQPDDIVAI